MVSVPITNDLHITNCRDTNISSLWNMIEQSNIKNIKDTENINKTFIIKCINGNLEEVKLYYTLNKINIHYNDNEAFYISCVYGHISVMQWLYSFGNINLYVYDNCALRWAC